MIEQPKRELTSACSRTNKPLRALLAADAEHKHEGENMKCPKCDSDFESVTYKEIQVDRCTGCYGLWFDMLEMDDLKKIAGAGSIDIGDKKVGDVHDQNRKIDCPKCHVPMIEMIDKDQFHIRFECCSSCYGTYFDAGEFRDLKEHTVMERFKQMISTVRTNLK